MYFMNMNNKYNCFHLPYLRHVKTLNKCAQAIENKLSKKRVRHKSMR